MNKPKILFLILLLVIGINPLHSSDLFDGDGPIKPALNKKVLNESASVANPGKVPVQKGVVRLERRGHHHSWNVAPVDKPQNAEFILRFNKPVPVGTVLFIGDFQASYLNSDEGTENWVKINYPGESKRRARIVPLPKTTETPALKLTAPCETDKDGKFKKSLSLVVPLKGRFVNIAPEAELKVSSSMQPKDGFRPDPRQANPECLLDGSVEYRNWWSASQETPISKDKPQWILLDWHQPKTMRGCILLIGAHDPGAGTVLVQRFVGKGPPDATDDSQWETVIEIKPQHPWRPPLCWEAVADFGKDITTQALRFLATAGLPKDQAAGGEGANDKAVSFAEIIVLQDLRDRTVPGKIMRRKSLPNGVVPITFNMPKSGKASIRIRNKQGEVIKNLVNGQPFEAGRQTVYWDLSNLEDYWPPFEPSKHEYRPPPETRKIALPGDYTWEGICHPPFKLEYKYSFYPLKKYGVAWMTSDTTGGWLGDHAPPKTVVRVGEKMWVGTFCEAGHALLEADLDMKKLWGSNRIWLACPKVMAVDNGKIYYLEQGGWARKIIMIMVDPETKRSRRLLGRDFKKDEKVDYAGLTVKDGKAYISDRLNDKILVLDIRANLAAKPQGFGWDRVYKLAEHEKMNVVKEIPVKKPGRIRPFDDQHLIAVADKSVVLIDLANLAVIPIVTGLANPGGLAWDPRRREIYVGELDPVHQVKVFNTDGKLLRTIGKHGPHQICTERKLFDMDNLENPVGLEVDANGNLWICEANQELKRTSVWNREGHCINHAIGPTVYGGGGDVDPRNPNRMFYGGKEFHRDPKTGKIKLARIIWRGHEGLSFSGPKAHNFGGRAPAYPFYNKDKLYFTMFQGWAMGGINCVYAYEDGHVKPVAAMGTTPGVINQILGRQHVDDSRFGHAILTRTDPKIDFNWGNKSPGKDVVNDSFAVRWTGDIVIPKTGVYTFYVNADDNARLTIDDDEVLSKWHWDRKRWVTEGSKNLAAGRHQLVLDFYENRGEAQIRLFWSGPDITKQIIPTSALRVSSARDAAQGLKGVYFNPGRSLFVWTDLNADGRIEQDEVKTRMYQSDHGYCTGVGGQWQFRINKNFQAAASTSGGGKPLLVFFKPVSYTEKGYPVYDLPDKLLPFPGNGPQAFMVDENGNAIVLSQYIYSINPEGKINWRYVNRWPSLHAGHRTSATGKEAGVLIATTRFFGSARVSDDIGEVVSINSNLGATYLFTADGFYLDRVFKDVRNGLSWRCDKPPSEALMNQISLADEHFGGTFQKTTDANGSHYQYVVGQPHCSVVELTGLDQVKRLPGGKVKVTANDLIAAERLRQLRALKKAVKKSYSLQRIENVKINGKDDEWPKERIDGFALGYDDKNLYVLFSGRDWRAPFKNSAGDNFTEAFKKGDVVDVMLQTDPGVDPQRGQAERGDIRISLTEVNGKPAAILYDFVVPGIPKDKRLSFSSPWRTIYIDQVSILPSARLAITRQQDRYTLEAAIPLKAIHLDPEKTPVVRGDVGRVLSDQTGSRAVDRVYWSNKNTKIMADVPSEAAIQPNLWGEFRFER